MQNNPNQNIHTDYQIDDIFKPKAANQLARAIHYDFVITQTMLDRYLAQHPDISVIDVGQLIASNEDGTDGPWETPVVAPVNIMISAKTSVDDPYTFHFGNRLIGHRSGTGTNYIVDCEDFMVGGQYNLATTKDMINVYSAYPYRMAVAVAGINHWTTPQNYVKIESNWPYNSGVFKVGTYSMPGTLNMGERDDIQLIIQNALGGGYTISPSAGHIETGYTPAVVYADWMGGGGGVTTNYAIRGQDESTPTTASYGLYQQMQASVADWNTEPILVVSHNYSTSRYLLNGWDSDEFRFSNLEEGKVVIIHKNGDVQWKDANVGGASSSTVIVTDFDLTPFTTVDDEHAYELNIFQGLQSSGQDRWRVFRPGIPRFLTVEEDVGTPTYGTDNPFDFKGATTLEWYTWTAISAQNKATGHAGVDWVFNPHNYVYIDVAALTEGQVYEVNLHIVKLPMCNETTTDYSGNPIIAQQAVPGDTLSRPTSETPQDNNMALFFCASGDEVGIYYWGSDAVHSQQSHDTLYVRFHKHGDLTRYTQTSRQGGQFLDLAIATIRFVKLGGKIYIMSY